MARIIPQSLSSWQGGLNPRKMRKWQFAGARNYAEFRAAGGKMPRIVIIIDEFHKLFETPDAVTPFLPYEIQERRL